MSVPGGWLPEYAPYPQRLASDGLPAVPTPAEVSRFGAGILAPPVRRRGRAILVTIAVVLLLVACGLAILVIIGLNTGTTGFLLGAVMAALPVPLLVGAFRWLDRYEPEPKRYLFFALAWGAAVATLFAITLNTVGASLFFPTPGNSDDPGLAAVFLAPPVEELAKGSVILILAWRRRIDGIVDGIVFAGMVGLGFACTENILYYGRAYAEISDDYGTGSGLFAVVVTFVLRGLVSPFAHPLFTMSVGIAVGIAVGLRSRGARVAVVTLGFVIAMGLHATWNGTATQGLKEFGLAYLLVMLPVFIAAIIIALWFHRREGRVLATRLPALAESGWIAPHEVVVLSSLRLRALALDLAMRFGGKRGREATLAYHTQVVALGFLRDRLARGRLGPAGLVQQVEMLAALPALRSQAMIPPPPGPYLDRPPPGGVGRIPGTASPAR